MKRRLVLSRETLAELSTTDLGAVAGAAQAITVNGLTCPLLQCNVDLSNMFMTCRCNTEPGCIA